MPNLTGLIDNNRAWSAQMHEREPDFFSRLLVQQAPEYLWIGCSDSRVPANQIVGLLPGELFVHRNVANVVAHTDLNCLSVLQFAVDVLRVKHVLVVGHYGCGGVRAAVRKEKLGLIDNWLRHVHDVKEKHQDFLAGITDEATRLDRVCELNVIEQVVHVCQTTVLRDAWARGQEVAVHGWIYRLHNGLVHDLDMSVASAESLDARHTAAVAAVMRSGAE